LSGNTLNEPQTLQMLCQIWVKLASRLREASVAHCDLQHGNVLLVPASKAGSLSVRLVDYDGMCVPALTLLKSLEVGHPCYQHPQRLREGTYSLEVDRFSHLVIYTALRALAVGGRALWDKYDNSDNLLFKQADFEAPGRSPLFAELLRMNSPDIRKLTVALIDAARKPLLQTPLLEEPLLKTAASQLITAANVPRPAETTAKGELPSGSWETSPPPVRVPARRATPTSKDTDVLVLDPDDDRGSVREPNRMARVRRRLIALTMLALLSLGFFCTWLVISSRDELATMPVPNGKTNRGGSSGVKRDTAADEHPPDKGGFVRGPDLKNPMGETDRSNDEPPQNGREPKVDPRNVSLKKNKEIGEEKPSKSSERAGEIHCFTRHPGEITSVAISEDAQTVLSGCKAGTLWTWNAATGNEIRKLEAEPGAINCVALSPRGKLALAGRASGRLVAWDVKTGTARFTQTGGGSRECIGFSARGDCLFTAAENGWLFRLPLDGRTKPDFTANIRWGKIRSLAPASDGRLVVFVDGQGKVHLHNLETKREENSLEDYQAEVLCVALAKDDSFLLTGAVDKTIRLWDLKTGARRGLLSGHSEAVTSIALSADGTRILSGSQDKTVRLWDLRTKNLIRTFTGHTGKVTSVAICGDGRLGVSGSEDKTVRVWRLSGTGSVPKGPSEVTKREETRSFVPLFNGKDLSGWQKNATFPGRLARDGRFSC
jgi:hypothetical protein